MTPQNFTQPKIVSREEWLTARRQLLAREKELTHQYDRINEERRALPMVEVTKDYEFEGAGGKVRLADLFEGRHQLIVYHFMFEPGDPPPGKTEPWTEGCSGCSFLTDNIGNVTHLHARDTTLALISRAPLKKIAPFKQRMGWSFPWYSSFGSDFNYDYHVTTDEKVAPVQYNFQDKDTLEKREEIYHLQGEQPGISVFLKTDDDRIFHTYSTYGRGTEAPLSLYRFLDLTPFGRGEGWGGMPDLDGKGYFWTKHHDKYDEEETGQNESCCASKASS